MKLLSALSVAILFGTAMFAADAQSVLALMDQAAPKFTGMTGDLTRVAYTKVLDDKTTESGTMKLRRKGRELQVLLAITKPDPQTVAFGGKKAEKYFPKLKTVQEYDLGKYKGVVDQFLLVGFGTSGRDLSANYAVKYSGEESVGGVKAYKLELVPNSPKMRESFRGLELWVAHDGGYPIQQRFVQPSGDYHLATYSNVKLNPPLTDGDLKLKLPSGVKREYPQK
jgi:outer membrane lipoprotein-sorting protein